MENYGNHFRPSYHHIGPLSLPLPLAFEQGPFRDCLSPRRGRSGCPQHPSSGRNPFGVSLVMFTPFRCTHPAVDTPANKRSSQNMRSGASHVWGLGHETVSLASPGSALRLSPGADATAEYSSGSVGRCTKSIPEVPAPKDSRHLSERVPKD